MSSTPVEQVVREESGPSGGWGSTGSANAAVGLHAAAAVGDSAAAQLHLARGAEPGALSAEGWAPLHLAAVGGDSRMVQLLLGAAAPADQRGGVAAGPWAGVGATALHCAAAGGHIQVVQLLIARGAAVDVPDGAGFTPLQVAAACGRVEVVRALVKAGADPFRRVAGATALDLARLGRHHDAVALLKQVEGCRAAPGGARPWPAALTGSCSRRR